MEGGGGRMITLRERGRGKKRTDFIAIDDINLRHKFQSGGKFLFLHHFCNVLEP